MKTYTVYISTFDDKTGKRFRIQLKSGTDVIRVEEGFFLEYTLRLALGNAPTQIEWLTGTKFAWVLLTKEPIELLFVSEEHDQEH